MGNVGRQSNAFGRNRHAQFGIAERNGMGVRRADCRDDCNAAADALQTRAVQDASAAASAVQRAAQFAECRHGDAHADRMPDAVAAAVGQRICRDRARRLARGGDRAAATRTHGDQPSRRRFARVHVERLDRQAADPRRNGCLAHRRPHLERHGRVVADRLRAPRHGRRDGGRQDGIQDVCAGTAVHRHVRDRLADQGRTARAVSATTARVPRRHQCGPGAAA